MVKCLVTLYFAKSNLLPCDKLTTREILMKHLYTDHPKQYESNCGHLFPCQHTGYDILLFESSLNETGTEISLGFKQDRGDHQYSRISVDEQTLIGQVGGILGILFGWSGMTLVEMFEYANLLLSYCL